MRDSEKSYGSHTIDHLAMVTKFEDDVEEVAGQMR